MQTDMSRKNSFLGRNFFRNLTGLLPEARQRPAGQKLYGGGRKIAAQARGFVIRISHFIDMSSVIGYSSKPPRLEDEIS